MLVVIICLLAEALRLAPMPSVQPALAVIGSCTPSFAPGPGSPILTAAVRSSVTIGLFNGDAFVDLAVTNLNNGTITIMLGNGSGSFSQAPGSPISVAGPPNAAVVGDFNGDRLTDLAIGNWTEPVMTILLGDGLGSFAQAPGSPFPIGVNPYALAVGRFNGDGADDLAIVNLGMPNGSLAILLGNGNGTFAPAAGSPISVPSGPRTVAVGSFNGDTNADLVVGSFTGRALTILLGNGSGDFSKAPGSPISVPGTPDSVVVGDFNGDGKDDFAAASFDFVEVIGTAEDGDVRIFLGNGNGTFAEAPDTPINVSGDPSSITKGSFNSDGFTDLVVGNSLLRGVTILLGDGTGRFTQPPGSPVSTVGDPDWVATGRLNGDIYDDIAIASLGNAEAETLLTRCSVADLGIAVFAPEAPAIPGIDLGYGLSVRNSGPDPASAVTVSDPLPPGTAFARINAPPGWSCVTPDEGATGTVTCTIGTLPPGDATISLDVHVSPSLPAPGTLRNIATISAETSDPTGADNSFTFDTTVVPNLGPCTPRPNIIVFVERADAERLLVKIAATRPPIARTNRLTEIRANIPPNAIVDVLNGPSGLTGQQSLPVGSGGVVQFYIRLAAPGPVTIPLVVKDTCGEWRTFVGGGSSTLIYPPPSVAPTLTPAPSATLTPSPTQTPRTTPSS
jgi:uncharacterized repeat protein (TIGR01451 family)